MSGGSKQDASNQKTHEICESMNGRYEVMASRYLLFLHLSVGFACVMCSVILPLPRLAFDMLTCIELAIISLEPAERIAHPRPSGRYFIMLVW